MEKSYREWLLREDELNRIVRGYVDNTADAIRRNPDGMEAFLDVLTEVVTESTELYLMKEYEVAWDETLSYHLALAPYDAERDMSVYRYIDGKNFADRIREYVASFGIDLNEAVLLSSLALLVATDGHRVRSEAGQDAGEELSSVGYTVTKTWRTMGDKAVREAHTELEGATLPIDEYFEVNGARALAPGMFGDPELDCNCRCVLDIKTEL